MGGKNSDHYKRLSISLPQELFQKFDNLRKELKLTRSDAIRKAMNSFLIEKEELQSKIKKRDIIAAISYIEKSHIHAHPPSSDHQHKNNAPTDNTNDSEKMAEERKTISPKIRRESPDSEHIHKDKKEHAYYIPVEQMEFLQANEIQHEFLDVIQSSLHIHLGPDSCLEMIACAGKYERIEKLYERLHKMKTIKKIELSIMDVF